MHFPIHTPQTSLFDYLSKAILALLLTFGVVMISGCGGGSDSSVLITTDDSDTDTDTDTDSDDSDDTDTDTDDDDSDTDTDASSSEALDPDNFISGALAEDISTVSCTLGNGTVTTCYSITFTGVPVDADVGPFCPENISETDEANVGIWLDGDDDGDATVYNVDGEFIMSLPTLYADTTWQLYDLNSGDVNVTDSEEACEAAAQPNVDPEYQNHCVECSLDYVNGGVSQAFLIPVTPVPAITPGSVGTAVGVSLNGVMIAAPAPVADILANYTIAAFDDCGGHINPVDGYHYHAATGCTETGTQSDDHSALLGYALDGYGIYGNEHDHTSLDECYGATDDVRGYHYHAGAAGSNSFIGCLSGEVEENNVATAGPP